MVKRDYQLRQSVDVLNASGRLRRAEKLFWRRGRSTECCGDEGGEDIGL